MDSIGFFFLASLHKAKVKWSVSLLLVFFNFFYFQWIESEKMTQKKERKITGNWKYVVEKCRQVNKWIWNRNVIVQCSVYCIVLCVICAFAILLYIDVLFYIESVQCGWPFSPITRNYCLRNWKIAIFTFYPSSTVFWFWFFLVRVSIGLFVWCDFISTSMCVFGLPWIGNCSSRECISDPIIFNDPHTVQYI